MTHSQDGPKSVDDILSKAQPRAADVISPAILTPEQAKAELRQLLLAGVPNTAGRQELIDCIERICR